MTDRVQEGLLRAFRDRTPTSARLFERATESLPGGVTRAITFHHPHPVTLDRGEGARVRDVDGHEYLDVQNNYTALIHGHNHPVVVRRLADVVGSGVVYNAPIELQRELAERIRERVDSVELIRFMNSGTEAVMNAVRLARAHTGRKKILKMEGAFHGSWDGVSVSVRPGPAPPDWPVPVPDVRGLAPGVEGGVLVAPFNDLPTTSAIVEEHGDDLAAVLVEAVSWAPGGIPVSPAFLTGLTGLCRAAGAVLILDEVVTFRLARGGAQELYGVVPDLTVFGKLIGGGLPIGALGGRRELMGRLDPRSDGYLPQSGTFSGSPLSMAAGAATLELLDGTAIDRLNLMGETVRERLSAELDRLGIQGEVTGTGSLGCIHLGPGPIRSYREAAAARKELQPSLHLALLNRGVLMDARGHFALSTPMEPADLDFFVGAVADALEIIDPLIRSHPADSHDP